MKTTERKTEMEKIDWKEWFCHLMQVAFSISTEKNDLTTEEYENYEKDGTESLAGAAFAQNLTDADVADFNGWFAKIADRTRFFS